MAAAIEVQPERGYLVLADISGFTAYLSTTELTHAHDILRDLLDTTLPTMQPLLTRIEVEGDAIFAYAPAARVPRGETLLEVLETTYAAFRDRVSSIQRGTTCACKACRDIAHLDLKFIVHSGEYVSSDVGGSFKLLGSDVNLVHRLSKNHVAASTGWSAYVLLSQAASEELGLDAVGMYQQTEQYEHFDEVPTLSFDLHPRYAQLLDRRCVVITPDDAFAILEQEIAASPQTVWTVYHDPHLRSIWERAQVTPVERPAGRTTIRAQTHCAHGKELIVETILDWKPFDYFTCQAERGRFVLAATYRLVPIERGTRLCVTLKITKGPLPGPILRLMCRHLILRQRIAPNMRALGRLAEEHDAERIRSGAAVLADN